MFKSPLFVVKSFLEKEELVRNKRGTTGLLKSAPDRPLADLDANIAPLRSGPLTELQGPFGSASGTSSGSVRVRWQNFMARSGPLAELQCPFGSAD